MEAGVANHVGSVEEILALLALLRNQFDVESRLATDRDIYPAQPANPTGTHLVRLRQVVSCFRHQQSGEAVRDFSEAVSAAAVGEPEAVTIRGPHDSQYTSTP